MGYRSMESGRLRLELEYFHRETAHNETSAVEGSGGVTVAKLDGELVAAEDRIGIILIPIIVLNAADYPEGLDWAVFAALVASGLATMLQARPAGPVGAGLVSMGRQLLGGPSVARRARAEMSGVTRLVPRTVACFQGRGRSG